MADEKQFTQPLAWEGESSQYVRSDKILDGLARRRSICGTHQRVADRRLAHCRHPLRPP